MDDVELDENTAAALKDLDTRLSKRLDTVDQNIDLLVDILTIQPGGPWTWELLEREAKDALFTQLFEFVTWLEERYLQHLKRDDYPLPACWFEHPVAVELLTALMVARMSVYQAAATIASSALVEWHERCLWPTFARLRELGVFTNCTRVKKHEPEAPRALTSDTDAFALFLARGDVTAAEEPTAS